MPYLASSSAFCLGVIGGVVLPSYALQKSQPHLGGAQAEAAPEAEAEAEAEPWA